jgi:hypothetical protein
MTGNPGDLRDCQKRVANCGQNLQHTTGARWQRMGRHAKNLVDAWWRQLSKRQRHTFLP